MHSQVPGAPRVRITYEVCIGDSIEVRELPFVAGVLADLAGTPLEPIPRFRDRKFVRIDRDNFDCVLEAMRPRVVVSVAGTILQNEYGSELAVDLTFRSLADFSPEAIASRISSVRELLPVRDGLARLREMRRRDLHEILIQPDLLSEVLSDLEAARDPLSSRTPGVATAKLLDAARSGGTAEDRASASVWLGDLLAKASSGASQDSKTILVERIAEIDRAVSRQVDEVLHHPDFQRLEATWRGLRYLVDQTGTSERLQLHVLNVSKGELARDLERAPSFDQSQVFRKVHDEVYGVLNVPPFAMLIGDYYFGDDSRDVKLLRGLAQVAAAANIVFVASAGPRLFNVTKFSELNDCRYPGEIFETEAYAAWKQFRESEDARFAGLVLPRILLRLPYDEGSMERFAHQEQVTEHHHYLWGNAAFAFAARVTNSFALCGWYAAIRGVEGGGMAPRLPVHRLRNADGSKVFVGPVEAAFPEREKELAELGFIPLSNLVRPEAAVFFSVFSCHKPKTYLEAEANACARASTALDRVLAACRFAHYLRRVGDDKVFHFMSGKEREFYLNRWISGYTLPQDSSDPRVRARYPLLSAKVQVTELADGPDIYRAILDVVPGYQFEENRDLLPMRIALILPR